MARVTNLRSSIVVAAVATAAALWATVGWCEPIVSEGTQGFVLNVDGGEVLVNDVLDGDINTAGPVTFEISSLINSGNGSGYFLNLFSPAGSQEFSNISFNTTTGLLSFSNTAFGTFSTTSFQETSNTAGFRSFLFTGTYQQGSIGSLVPNPTGATFALNLSQTPAFTGAISANGTLTLVPQPVPEPTTLTLAGFGLAALATRLSRRRSAGLSA